MPAQERDPVRRTRVRFRLSEEGEDALADHRPDAEEDRTPNAYRGILARPSVGRRG